MLRFAEIKQVGIQYNDMKKKTIRIMKSSMDNIKIYNLQDDGCSASVTFGKVSTALTFSTN